ncbi:MAG: NfeD family protein [Deltaproteobacteria bacterium]|nr:NfeD family protein [Deltaproteobacteria bacterium]
MKTWTRYLLFQVPGWILAAVILLGLRYWIGLPLWIAIGAFSLWVIKDLGFYPLLRKAYESSPKTGADQRVGLRGVAREQLDPCGYVHVRGELWRAETESSDRPISAGSPVRVVRANGMTLIVTSEGSGATGSG